MLKPKTFEQRIEHLDDLIIRFTQYELKYPGSFGESLLKLKQERAELANMIGKPKK